MTTTLVLLCLCLLDVMKPPVTDEFGKQFAVTEVVEQSLTGCTTSPQAGRVSNHQIFVDYVGDDDPHDTATSVSALTAANYHAVMESPTVPAMIPHDPSGLPDPNPETPPVAVVPEPPTLAILTISGIALLYLLFGKRKKERLYRRT